MVRRSKAAQNLAARRLQVYFARLKGRREYRERERKRRKREYDAAKRIQGLFKRTKARALITTLIRSIMQKKYDPETKRYYYENAVTGEVTWTKPRLLKAKQDLSEDVGEVWTCETCGYARNAVSDVEQMGEARAECRLCFRPYSQSVEARKRAEAATDEGKRRTLEEQRAREEEEAKKLLVPCAPTDCNAQAGDGTSLVWWTLGPEVPGGRGRPLEAHVVIKQRLDGEAWKDKGVTEVAADATRATIHGCSNGHTYRFVVRARSSVGLSAPSEPSQEVVPNPVLPRGWRMVKGEDAGEERMFYFNEETKQRTWERPTKDVYWVSDETKRTVDFSPKEISELRTRFREIDTDESGGVDRHELKIMIRDMGIKNCPPKRLKALFAEADADKSGTIDFNEFVMMIHKINTGEISGFGKLMGSIGSLAGGAKRLLGLSGDDARLHEARIEAKRKMGAWALHKDPALNKEYYFNRHTQETSWKMPDEVRWYVPAALKTKFTRREIQELKDEFVAYDLDGSGSIDEDELTEIFNKLGEA